MKESQPSRKVPVLHLLMGMSGWALYLFESYPAIMILAWVLSVLVVPRIIRGSWDKADFDITEELERPIRPSKRVGKVISKGERLLWETHEHPISLIFWELGAILWTGGSVVAGVYINWQTAAITWGVGMLIAGSRVFLWQHDRLCLTDKRILVVRGILKVQCLSMPLNKLTDETLQIPWHSTILSWFRLIRVQYGTLIVESAGQDQALSKVYCVPTAIQVNRIIMTRALK